jgi:hypothetical protein
LRTSMQTCFHDSTRPIFALLTVLLFAWPAAAEPPPEKDWEIRFTPYIEFSNIAGSMTAEGREIDINAGFGDIFKRLNFAAFGEVGVRWRRLVASVDVIYTNLGDKRSFGPLPLEWELEQVIVDAKFGYRLLSRHVGPGSPEAGSTRGRLDLDLLAGLRYWQADTDFDVGPLPFDVHQDWVEPLFGFRLGWQPFERWWFGARGDAGGFSAGNAEVTWRAALLGSFALGRHWDLVAGYRALGIAEANGSGVSRAALDYVMHGPVLGVSLHF